MLKKIIILMCTLPFIFMGKVYSQEQSPNAYVNYDFIAGDTLLFEDNNQSEKEDTPLRNWRVLGGKAELRLVDGEKCVSILQYYTVLTPKLKATTYLGDAYTIEFDYWLDAGYDGNPGITISLRNKDEVAVIVPNRNDFSYQSKNANVTAETPPELFGEKFYNRWLHIALSVRNKTLKVYANQYNVLTVPNFDVKATNIAIKGDESQDMKMLFKNFRLAKGGGRENIGVALNNGKYISHGIHFDANMSVVKAESMGEINAIAATMKENTALKYEIGGYTDSDGDDAANRKLSEARAQAVQNMLVNMGIDGSRLSIKGYGKSNPIADNKSPEGKANNRRVEFVKQ